jgi:hypothetical protein
MIEVRGDPSDIAFYYEIIEVYKSNKRKINKKIFTSSELDLLDFCSDSNKIAWGFFQGANIHLKPSRTIKYENVCKLALIFANVLGKQMPSHIHNRMVLGLNNRWVKEYVDYVNKLKPRKFGIFNLNPNNYRLHKLSNDGDLIRMKLK